MTFVFFESMIDFTSKGYYKTESACSHLPESDLSEAEFEFEYVESDIPQIQGDIRGHFQKAAFLTLFNIPKVFPEISYPPPQG